MSLKRVADFLGVECPGPPPSLTAGAGEGAAAGGGGVGDPGAAIVVRGGSFSWGSGGCGAGSSGGAAGGSGPAGRGLGTEQARQATGAVLSGVDLEVPKGALVAVTGEVSSLDSSKYDDGMLQQMGVLAVFQTGMLATICPIQQTRL